MSGFTFCGLAIVHTATTGVVQTFGRVTRQMTPGLNFYIPIVQTVKLVSNRLRNQNFKFEIKTKDNVFATMGLSIQHKVDDEKSSLSVFSLDNPEEQIDAYIENLIRSTASKMTIDELFESQNDLCHTVSDKLSDKMSSFGYRIENVLVTGIDPDKSVKEAMNRINASKRLFEAAKNEADAKFIAAVREAEGDRDRKRLQGEGISEQRRAIVNGFRDSIKDMSNTLGVSHDRIIDFVIKTQQLDTLEQIGRSPNTKTVFIPYDDHNHTKPSRLVEGSDADLTYNDTANVTPSDTHSDTHSDIQSVTQNLIESVTRSVKEGVMLGMAQANEIN